jgi:predicted SPOUT superfamily RNA methylase MTH1
MSDEKVKAELEKILTDVMNDPEYLKRLAKTLADHYKYEGVFIKLRIPEDPEPK